MTGFEWAGAAFGVVVVIALYRIAQDVEAIREHLTKRPDDEELDERGD